MISDQEIIYKISMASGIDRDSLTIIKRTDEECTISVHPPGRYNFIEKHEHWLIVSTKGEIISAEPDTQNRLRISKIYIIFNKDKKITNDVVIKANISKASSIPYKDLEVVEKNPRECTIKVTRGDWVFTPIMEETLIKITDKKIIRAIPDNIKVSKIKIKFNNIVNETKIKANISKMTSIRGLI